MMRSALTSHYLGSILFLWFASITFTFAQSSTFGDFLGVNLRNQDPLDKSQVANLVREYHPWAFDEGFPGLNGLAEYASPGYPNNQYKWNPGYQGQSFILFDDFYEQMYNQGQTINVVLMQSAPYIVNPNLLPSTFDVNLQLEQKPVFPEDSLKTTLPSSYVAHADWMYQFAARYGQTSFSANRQSTLVAPKLHPQETVVTGLGYVEYIENWNEQDKFWYIPQFPSTYFTPAEFAAMCSADFDGHMQTLALQPDPDNPGDSISTVGVKNADPNMKFVMGGLSTLDTAYIDGMVAWCDSVRSPSTPFGQYPFDAINFHHYSNSRGFPVLLNGVGLSPEQDSFRHRLEKVVAYRDAHLAGKELWLTEFGYDTDSLSTQRVPWTGIGNNDPQEVQAQWLTRGVLEASASGIDRIVLYDLRDACTGPDCGLFVSSGLLRAEQTGFQPKKSWYYLYSMRQVLNDYVFDADLSACSDTDCAADCTQVLRFKHISNPDRRVYVLWSPTTCDRESSFSLDLEGASEAILVEMQSPSIRGKESLITGDTVSVNVSERPIMVVVEPGKTAAQVSCVSNIHIDNQTCGSVRIRWDEDPSLSTIQVWYMNGHTTELDISNAFLAEGQYPIDQGSFNLTGLVANQDYSIFLVAQDSSGYASDPCFIQTNTLSSSCQVVVDSNWVFDSSDPSNPPFTLFDEQASGNPLCGSGFVPTTPWGYTPDPDPVYLSIDLQDYFYLDAITLFDGAGVGDLIVEYSDSPNGPWNEITTFLTTEFGIWITLSNLLPPDQAVRFLRFESQANAVANVDELFLCLRPATVDDSAFPPGAVKNLQEDYHSCNSIDLSWEAPFDPDLDFYSIQVNTSPPRQILVPATQSKLQASIYELSPGESYTISVNSVDIDGNASLVETIIVATLDVADCTDDCQYTCDCRLCLKPAWITNQTIAPGIDATRLIDEQASIDPICANTGSPTQEWGANWNPAFGIPPAIAQLDLQNCYELQTLYLYDLNGSGDFRVEYKADTSWVVLTEFTTDLWNQWRTVDMTGITARFLRFTKLDNQAQIPEIAICGTVDTTNSCLNIPPSTDQDGDGFDLSQSDCDDFDATVYPGAPELCDGKDNDCNGLVDDGAPQTLWYLDSDGDGFGTSLSDSLSCAQPVAYVANDADCNDADGSIYPAATETCDGIDNDCNGSIDDNVILTSWFLDSDGDGFGDPSVDSLDCTQPIGYVANSLDCNDTNASIAPAAVELCDGIDNDCNGLVDDQPLDNTPPVITCQDITLRLDPGQGIQLDGNQLLQNYQDDCSPIGPVSTNPSALTSSQSGNNPVELLVEDAVGNAATCTANVFIEVNTPTGEYCTSAGQTPWVEWISEVRFSDLIHPSGKDLYGDFTSETATVEHGGSYELAVQPKFSWPHYSEYIRVWIDYNQDFDFTDPGELVLEQVSQSGTPPSLPPAVATSITIPSNAALGTTRMRVSMQRDAYGDPCEAIGNGEVEDYSVFINASGPILTFTCRDDIVVTAPQGTTSTAVFWSAPSGSTTCNDPNVSVTQTIGLPSGSVFSAGSSIIEYEATDTCGNVEACSFQVIIQIPSSLSLDCPADITVDAPIGSTESVASWPDPVVTEDCPLGSAILSQVSGAASGSLFPAGVSTISYEISDPCGNVVNCSFTIEVRVNNPASYCGSSGQSPWQEWIGRVTFANMDHSSFKELYADFTAIAATVDQDATYSLRVFPGFSWSHYDEYIRVWIDYNQDGDFENAGELVAEGISPVGTPPAGGTGIDVSVTIPNTASLGATRMRVSMHRDGYVEPCETFNLGEVEDYTIVILAGSGANRLTPPQRLFQAYAVGHQAELQWSSNLGAEEAFFVLERADQTGTFEEIAKLPSAKVADISMDYHFVDRSPVFGWNTYRLQQIMESGEVFLFPEKQLYFPLNPADIQVFPNPATGKFYIQIPPLGGLPAQLQMINTHGEIVRNWKVASFPQQALEIPVDGLIGGVYVIFIQVEGYRKVGRRVVVVDRR